MAWQNVSVPLFRRQRTTPAVTSDIRAEIGRGQGVGNFQNYSSSWTREQAMRVPTISRARDLLASMIASADIEQYAIAYQDGEPLTIDLAPESWMNRPDPANTRNFILAWTVDDLMMTGRAFWGVSARYANGFPSAFTWLPASMITTADQAGPTWYGPSDQIQFNGVPLPSRDVVQFLSPIQGILSAGSRAITIAQRLDSAAERFSRTEIPAGWLQSTPNSEPLTSDELAELAAAWSEARQSNAIAALSGAVEWHESAMDPDRLQLVEARAFQKIELANVANVPAYLVGASVSGMTYQNAEQASRDLYVHGARPLLDCIAQTLSGDNVIPRGRYVRLSLDRYFSIPTADGETPGAPASMEVPA